LTNLLKNKIKFCFADKEKRAFQQLREVLNKRPVLKICNRKAETELHTDAFAQEYAAILLQPDDEDRYIRYIIRAEKQRWQNRNIITMS